MCVCARVHARGGFVVCVCGGGAGGVFEEMAWVLKILQRESEIPGLMKILMMVQPSWSEDNNRVL